MGASGLRWVSVAAVAALAAGLCRAVVVQPSLHEPAVPAEPTAAQRSVPTDRGSAARSDPAARLPADVERVMSAEPATGAQVLDLLDELQMGAPLEPVAPAAVRPGWTGQAAGRATDGARDDAGRRAGGRDAPPAVASDDADDPTAWAVAWLRERRDWVIASAAGTLALAGLIGWLRERGTGTPADAREGHRRHRRRRRSGHGVHGHHGDRPGDRDRTGHRDHAGRRASSGDTGGHMHTHRDGRRRRRRIERVQR